MTTAAMIRQEWKAGRWTALEAAEGLCLALSDDTVKGVSPTADDPDTWLLIGELFREAGITAAKALLLVKAVL